MALWGRALFGGVLLSPAMTAEMLTAIPDPSGFIRGRDVYPLGWSTDGQTMFALVERRELVSVRVADGETTLLAKLPFEPSAGTTLDGSRFVFSVPGSIGDAWVVEDFDPER